MASSIPTLAIATLLLASISAPFPSKAAADSSPECPYPCLPPPTSAADCPPPPPSPPLQYPPPPPQPYTPGYYPPPSWGPGNVPYYPSPRFEFPAPPPPDRIMPYFPYYFRSSSEPLHKCCWLGVGLPMALLHLILLVFFLS